MALTKAEQAWHKQDQWARLQALELARADANSPRSSIHQTPMELLFLRALQYYDFITTGDDDSEYRVEPGYEGMDLEADRKACAEARSRPRVMSFDQVLAELKAQGLTPPRPGPTFQDLKAASAKARAEEGPKPLLDAADPRNDVRLARLTEILNHLRAARDALRGLQASK